MPFPPQGPQGPMGFGQPRPPLMGYGGMSSDCTLLVFVVVDSAHYFCFDFESSVAGGPPYPPNQYGGGRGNYDNFRGQGGYLGKPRNIRWDHCTCDLYFALVCVRFLLLENSDPLYSWSFLFFFSGLFFSSPCTLNHLRMSRGDPRNIIEYRDLDAPDDMDFF